MDKNFERQKDIGKVRTEDTTSKEQYLDGIVSRLSSLKPDGRPVDGHDLLGTDHQRGVELFGLHDFSPSVQTDILLGLAYFRSPAFEERVAQSLGYESGASEMSELDRDFYNSIVQRARSACHNISFEVVDDIRKSHNESVSDDKTVVRIPNGHDPQSEIFDSLGVTVHEMAHHIYNSAGSDTVNPGIYHQGSGSSLEPSLQYGSLLSPYDRINESNLDRSKVEDIYGKLNENLAKDSFERGDISEEKYNELTHRLVNMTPDQQNEHERYIDDRIRHDNTGYERAADIHAARIIMFREGIWNPFGREPLQPEHIEEFRLRHPNSRIFEYWNDGDAVMFLNTIARNEPEHRPVIENKKDLNQMIADYNPRELMGKLEELSSVMYGRKVTDIAQSDRSQLSHLDVSHMNRRISSPLELTAMNFEAEAQSISEGQQEHRSYGHSV